MNRIVFAVLEIIAAALFLIPIYLVLNRMWFRSLKKTFAYCIFSFYLVAVYSLVGMPCITYVRLDLGGNLMPIVGLIGDLKNSVLNVLLFVPLGFLLPLLWEKFRTWKQTVLFGFGLSLAIELLQIFTMRATDVNDLITNVCGTVLGYGMAEFLFRKVPAVQNILKFEKGNEVYLICGIVLVVMFFFQPFPAAYLWEVFH